MNYNICVLVCCGERITSLEDMVTVRCCNAKLHASCADAYFDEHDECPNCGLPVRAYYYQDGDKILVRDDDENDDEEPDRDDDDDEEDDGNSGIDDDSEKDASGEQDRSSENGVDRDFIDDDEIAEKSWSDGSEAEYEPSPPKKRQK